MITMTKLRAVPHGLKILMILALVFGLLALPGLAQDQDDPPPRMRKPVPRLDEASKQTWIRGLRYRSTAGNKPADGSFSRQQ